MASQRALLPIEEALAKILAVAQPLAAEEVAVAAARGRFLAQDAVARVDLPPFDSSAMDGFALRVEDTPGRLRVAATIAAGAPVEAAIEPREAMAIATGAAVPSGADAVVPIERVRELEGEIAIGERPPQGANIRLRGGDVRAGEVVVGRGSRLGPPQLGALAAAGCNRISCSCRPRVAIVCTGSELRPAGADLGPGQIYESNGALLAGSAASAGAEVENLGIVPDDRQAHRQALESGLAADVLLTT
ncbi:MAG: molybdopterin molybdotransferase MoeA, partial [Gaiellaceae bacterium]